MTTGMKVTSKGGVSLQDGARRCPQRRPIPLSSLLCSTGPPSSVDGPADVEAEPAQGAQN